MNKREILSALSELGLASGDHLLVHASLSKTGLIEGGAHTVIDSLAECVETVLFPTFNYCFERFGGEPVSAPNLFHPYKENDFSRVWTGTVPQTLLADYAATRSRHYTHSWAGFGMDVHEMTAPHLPDDPPCSKNSPLGMMLRQNGKVLFWGTGLAPNTFLHYLEDAANVPYLKSAVCAVEDDKNMLRHVTIPRHLPGHRDFYRADAESCKFYKRAIASGLKICEVPLGTGKLQCIELKELYRIGMELLQEDSFIFLCDNQECAFCSRFKI